MNIALLAVGIGGLLLIFGSIPFLLGKVPPNRWAGFRIRATLQDPSLWYPANVYVAKYLLATGVVLTLLPVLFLFFGAKSGRYIAGLAMIALFGAILTFLQGLRFVTKNKKDRPILKG